MDDNSAELLIYGIAVLFLVYLALQVWFGVVRDKTLRRVARPMGGYHYEWRDPFGRLHSSRTHPKRYGNGIGADGGGTGGGDCDSGD